MGVCCVVFDIDGMLFEYFMNFLNIEKKKKKKSSKFHVFFVFHAISNIKKNCVKKIWGGGVKIYIFFFRKAILSHFTFYDIFNIQKKNYWKVALHLLVKLEVVSPNSRWGQLGSMSIISSIPLFWFCISNVGVVWGGGVMFFSYFMLFTTLIEKKLGIQFFFLRKTIISHLMFSSCFFKLEILKSAPSLTG